MTARRLLSGALLVPALVLTLLFAALPASADDGSGTGSRLAQTTQQNVDSDSSIGGSAKRRTTVRTLTNPLHSTDLQGIIGRIARIFTGVAGSFALLMFIYGGVIWLTSGGSPDRVQRGKKIFVWATIGLIVIFGAYGIIETIFRALNA